MAYRYGTIGLMTGGRSRARKVTFTIDEQVVAAIEAAVEDGVAPSKSALVGEAVVKYLSGAARERRRREWQEAAQDPRLLADIEAVMRDFASADAEAWADLEHPR